MRAFVVCALGRVLLQLNKKQPNARSTLQHQKNKKGLPATVTSLLSLTALRLRERQVLIKRTDIIENLGIATIICSDKTGTLTMNRMT